MEEQNNWAVQLWERGECLLVDSVTFADGRVALLDVSDTYYWQVPKVRLIRFTDIAELYHPGEPVNGSLGMLAECKLPEKDLLISAGEGAWGSNGFVEVTNLSNGKLKWLLFLTYVGPFEVINVQGDVIDAINTVGKHFQISIDHPEQIRVLPKK